MPRAFPNTGADDARVHAGHLNASAAPPLGELGSQKVVGKLGATRHRKAGPAPSVLEVVEVQCVAVLAGVGDEDQASIGRGLQEWKHPASQEIPRQVVDYQIPLQTLGGVLRDGGEDAGTADQCVQPVRHPAHRVDEAGGVPQERQVSRDEVMLSSGADAMEIVEDRIGPLEVAAGEEDSITTGCEAQRHGAPDPTGTIGH